ncbi:hypothetical protein BGW38_001215 [Lunasporangiospora selenospora]|uniref:Lytic polysaccharide monooxygenase n=1 Tax=Lunasporangiospora selenospora TaxID=979761 RepID=A0A9P6KDP5_9FUNG|nr:hypothetical protein BGW38_001215 [Lunasporangiospora selenospora]
MPRGGISTKQYDGKILGPISSAADKTMPCNGYTTGPVTTMKAGQVINVRFWVSELRGDRLKTLPPINGDEVRQGRHGGGSCEFSLSTDGGKTFHLIGKYTKTCPDVYAEWPVKIPDSAPNCDTPGQCLFVWSWIAGNVPQFYQNCADIKLIGKEGGTLPKTGITIVNVPGKKKGVKAKGDGTNSRSKGPNKAEVEVNLKGVWN